MNRIPYFMDKLLIFHRGLGCNHENATYEERSERLLFFYSANSTNQARSDHSEAKTLFSSTNCDSNKIYGTNGRSADNLDVVRSCTTNGTENIAHSEIADTVLSDSTEGEEMLSILHMLESLLEFSNKFCRKIVEFVLTEEVIWVFFECEENVFFCASVALNKNDKEGNEKNDCQTSKEKVNQCLHDLYRAFVSQYGTIDSILSSSSSISTSFSDLFSRGGDKSSMSKDRTESRNDDCISVNIDYNTSNNENEKDYDNKYDIGNDKNRRNSFEKNCKTNIDINGNNIDSNKEEFSK
jgi:hypothetical protein